MENTGYPCPGCGAPADLASGCPGCGRPPYPPAAEVVRLDREIAALAPEVERARGDVPGPAGPAGDGPAAPDGAGRPDPPGDPAAAAAPGAARPRVAVGAAAGRPETFGAGPGRPETSTRTVQGLLFVLGGLLLGTAAIVFTAVAWAAVGVAGRALILAAVTVLALAGPLIATRRGLRGTAETFAAVGLLLVLLDGYAAWTVDLFGVAGWPGTRYAALVGGIGAAAAAGYAPAEPADRAVVRGAAGRAAGAAAGRGRGPAVGRRVGAGLHRGGAGGPPGGGRAAPPGSGRRRTADGRGGRRGAGRRAAPGGTVRRTGRGADGDGPGRIPGRYAGGGRRAGARLARPRGRARRRRRLRAGATGPGPGGRQPVLAGGPLLLVGVVLLAGALAAGGRTYRLVTAGLLVPVLAAALLRPVAELRPGLLLVAAGAVVAVLAGAVRAAAGETALTGPRVGALVVAGGLAQVATLATLVLAGGAVLRSLPPWRGAAAGPAPHWGWQLPVAAPLTAAAVALLLPRAARPVVAVVGGALAVLAAPAVAATPWPSVVAADLLAAVALLAVAVLRPRRRYTTVLVRGPRRGRPARSRAAGRAAGPAGALAALAVVAVAGALVAARGRQGAGGQPVVGGVALAARCSPCRPGWPSG